MPMFPNPAATDRPFTLKGQRAPTCGATSRVMTCAMRLRRSEFATRSGLSSMTAPRSGQLIAAVAWPQAAEIA